MGVAKLSLQIMVLNRLAVSTKREQHQRSGRYNPNLHVNWSCSDWIDTDSAGTGCLKHRFETIVSGFDGFDVLCEFDMKGHRIKGLWQHLQSAEVHQFALHLGRQLSCQKNDWCIL